MTQVRPSVSELLQQPGGWHCHRASQIVSAGGVIAYPTEAVWGLGCNPWDQEAVERIYDLKVRPMRKGLILVAADIQQLDFLFSVLPGALRTKAQAHWPGPVTLLVPDPEGQIPQRVKGENSTIAVRVSAHPLVRRLCQAVGGPLVSTSCNPAGHEPARQAWQVRKYFPAGLDMVVPGRLGGLRQPSQIIDLETGRRLR
ncbi:MAG: L-threonylcarbamoyladenylate synthase [Marinobacter sp.]|nr:L-threonylcarbamoyladenylate synthase [Marinobacter sp.]